jgi:phospholipid/cholesterol/gamma-HCH transport system ATP-binding protein
VSGAPFLVFDAVHKAFGDKRVLRGVDLEVLEGETLVILGGSGTGKSVALRHIIGLELPDQGRVIVDGQEVQDLGERDLVPVRRKVGFLFQSGALFDSLNVFDNLAFGLREARWEEGRIRERVREVLGLVDLGAEVESLHPSSLSGGMRKRVALARAIAIEPRAILYDEPTTGLDPVTANTINDLMRSTQERLEVTSVVVTHDINSAFRVGDRVAFLHEGKIRFVGTVEETRRGSDPVLADFLAGRGDDHDGTTRRA